jgi:2,4-dienoyl-CoA reductase-like NADH-dependent reductase (Old Yellow Enzyme family)
MSITTKQSFSPVRVGRYTLPNRLVMAPMTRSLMHAGRMSHPDNTPHHRQGVAPSAIAPGTQTFTATGLQDVPTPRALTAEEVRQPSPTFAFRRVPPFWPVPMVSRFTVRMGIMVQPSAILFVLDKFG